MEFTYYGRLLLFSFAAVARVSLPLTMARRLHVQMSPISGWMWRGRKGSGVVNGVKGLGMLQHLRDSRLIPYRLGCNCLYDHPALKHLLTGRESGQVLNLSIKLAVWPVSNMSCA